MISNARLSIVRASSKLGAPNSRERVYIRFRSHDDDGKILADAQIQWRAFVCEVKKSSRSPSQTRICANTETACKQASPQAMEKIKVGWRERRRRREKDREKEKKEESERERCFEVLYRSMSGFVRSAPTTARLRKVCLTLIVLRSNQKVYSNCATLIFFLPETRHISSLFYQSPLIKISAYYILYGVAFYSDTTFDSRRWSHPEAHHSFHSMYSRWDSFKPSTVWILWRQLSPMVMGRFVSLTQSGYNAIHRVLSTLK